MSVKGRVLSIRLTEQDIASSKELCDLLNIRAVNMSTCVVKALSLLLENLRENGTLKVKEPESVSALLHTLSETRLPGREFNFVKVLSEQKEKEQTPARVRQLTQQKDDAFPPELEALLSGSAITKEEQLSFPGLDETEYFDPAFAEEMKLTEQLQEEELLLSLTIVERREDDKDVKLIDPSLMKKKDEEKSE